MPGEKRPPSALVKLKVSQKKYYEKQKVDEIIGLETNAALVLPSCDRRNLKRPPKKWQRREKALEKAQQHNCKAC